MTAEGSQQAMEVFDINLNIFKKRIYFSS